jgi:bifunctional non-homologous end joining protein LigD
LLRWNIIWARTTVFHQMGSNRFKHMIAVPRENIQTLLPGAIAPSKKQLANYWERVSQQALRYLGRRPLRLVRSVNGTTFYHGGPLPPVPTAVRQLRIEKRQGGQGIRPWVDSLEGLLGLVDIDVVELHPWGATVDDIERPDVLTFDLEPGREITWEFVVDTAFKFRAMLRSERLDSWPKVTGGKDLHVMVPIAAGLKWDEARRYSKELAQQFAATEPNRYTLVSGATNRKGKVFIDYQRNGRGVTAIGAYSPRALPGFPIVAPVTWSELEKGLRSDAFTIERPKIEPKPTTSRRRTPVRSRRARARS